jgi:hypothetical protein
MFHFPILPINCPQFFTGSQILSISFSESPALTHIYRCRFRFLGTWIYAYPSIHTSLILWLISQLSDFYSWLGCPAIRFKHILACWSCCYFHVSGFSFIDPPSPISHAVLSKFSNASLTALCFTDNIHIIGLGRLVYCASSYLMPALLSEGPYYIIYFKVYSRLNPFLVLKGPGS